MFLLKMVLGKIWFMFGAFKIGAHIETFLKGGH